MSVLNPNAVRMNLRFPDNKNLHKKYHQNYFKNETEDLEKKTRRVLSDARKKRNVAVPGLNLKTCKEHDLDRTSVNKEAALFLLRHVSEAEIARSLLGMF